MYGDFGGLVMQGHIFNMDATYHTTSAVEELSGDGIMKSIAPVQDLPVLVQTEAVGPLKAGADKLGPVGPVHEGTLDASPLSGAHSLGPVCPVHEAMEGKRVKRRKCQYKAVRMFCTLQITVRSMKSME